MKNDLIDLAIKHKTDKWGEHFYALHYQKHFETYRFKKNNLLEIGVGGYSNPNIGGNSLRMWKEYFPNGNIYSIDIYDKSELEENRIKIFKGSQSDESLLLDIVAKAGSFDIIIDDGSHINKDVIDSFTTLFPHLKDNGIYVIEDVQTSYWPPFGGGFQKENTIMNFCKRLTDCLNHKEFLIKDYDPNYFDKHITSIHFYHNLIFIYKGNNNEKSNLIENGDFKDLSI
jgi:hypothetical protein